MGCTSLTSIALPHTLTNTYAVYDYAFKDCTSLSSITWDKDADGNMMNGRIGAYVFSGCTSLTHLIIPATAVMRHNTFTDVGAYCTMYFIVLPGPSSTWTSGYRWLFGCEAKFVWGWSEDKGFLNEEGTFENEVVNTENAQNAA